MRYRPNLEWRCQTCRAYNNNDNTYCWHCDGESTAINLSREQISGLRRIHDRGPGAWCDGQRVGGATASMFARLITLGLVEGPPYCPTRKGVDLLIRIERLAVEAGRK